MKAAIFFLAACLTAATAPLFSPSAAADHPPAEVRGFPGWPTHLEGRPLVREPLSEDEAPFAAKLPGKVGRFNDGECRFILRWIARPTRHLHPADLCFRTIGYRVGPRRLWRDAGGRTWSRFTAEKGDERLEVRVRIHDEQGGAWTDVSTWFWDATLLGVRGPWWSTVRVARAVP